MSKTFFLSEDIELILEGNSYLKNYFQKKGIEIPNSSQIRIARKEMKKNLKNVYQSIEIIPEKDMVRWMKDLAQESSYPLYSFDEIYLNENENIDDFINLTRLKVGNQTILTTRNSGGEVEPFENEINRVALNILKSGNNKISLIDDVVFSGDLICQVAREFAKYGINVDEVLCAVCIKEGFEKLNIEGITVKTKKLIDNVLDEVCERDFYFGLPQSGQSTMLDSGVSAKQPYFLPFGDPVERASIQQDKARDFSVGCLGCSLYIWSCMENNSNKNLYISDLPENIYGLYNGRNRIVKVLEEAQGRLLN